jgi:type II secretory pathway component PulJ
VVSVPVVLVLAIVGMVSLVAVAAVVSQLLARVKRLAADLQEIERDLMPRVDRLREGTDVTGREMERLSRRGGRTQRAARALSVGGAVATRPRSGRLDG